MRPNLVSNRIRGCWRVALHPSRRQQPSCTASMTGLIKRRGPCMALRAQKIGAVAAHAHEAAFGAQQVRDGAGGRDDEGEEGECGNARAWCVLLLYIKNTVQPNTVEHPRSARPQQSATPAARPCNCCCRGVLLALQHGALLRRAALRAPTCRAPPRFALLEVTSPRTPP